MTKTEIIETLKNILKTVMPEHADYIESCDETADLHTDMGLNSIGLLYIVIAMETTFGVSFDGASFSDFSTVADIVRYIEERQ